jgi:predicted transcriptional regulator
VTLKEIRPIPQQRWATTPVNQVMTPVERLAVATPQQDLREILSLLVKRNVNQLPVVQDGYLIGAVSREHLLRFLEIRRTLDLEMDGENEVSLSSSEY